MIFTIENRQPLQDISLIRQLKNNRRSLTEKRVFSPSHYYEAGTSANALKWHIISAGLWLDYLHTSLLISIYQNSVGIIYHYILPKRHPNFSIIYGKIMTSQFRRKLIIFICVGEFMNLFILFFKPSFSNRTETEIKCKIGIRKNMPFAFFHIQILGV
jgi:hypothetical protein